MDPKQFFGVEGDKIAARISLAYFVTHHGFGHSARACAVMQALESRVPGVNFDVFTEAPEWFFRRSLGDGFTYHPFASDVGLVQSSPFHEDLKATVQKLNEMQSTEEERLSEAARALRDFGSRLVLCDIAPSGIEAAQRVGIPSVLIENFTWDFIYAGYAKLSPELNNIGLKMRDIFEQADVHIQAKPACQPDAAFLQVEPVSRRPKSSRSEIRRMLGIPEEDSMILILQGGIEAQLDGLDALRAYPDIWFVLPGSAEQFTVEGNLILLPHQNDFYTPDLVYASDAVVGKLGYGTVAEVYQAGMPFGYIPRDSFPETPSMTDFIRAELNAIEFPYADFVAGRWGDLPEKLLSLPRIQRTGLNGADQIAKIISELLRQ